MNGGYVMVDCSGIELTTETKQTITGIRSQVENAYQTNKPVFAYNLEWDGVLATPIQTMITLLSDGTYVCTASTLQLWVDEDDGVTIINMAPAN